MPNHKAKRIKLIFDHPRSSVVYNFGGVSLYACMYVYTGMNVCTLCLRKKRGVELFAITSSTVNQPILKSLSLMETAINYL